MLARGLLGRLLARNARPNTSSQLTSPAQHAVKYRFYVSRHSYATQTKPVSRPKGGKTSGTSKRAATTTKKTATKTTSKSTKSATPAAKEKAKEKAAAAKAKAELAKQKQKTADKAKREKIKAREAAAKLRLKAQKEKKKTPSKTASKTAAATINVKLRKAALLTSEDKPPASVVETAWSVLTTREAAKAPGTPAPELAKSAKVIYDNLTPAEREALNEEANRNRAANEAAHKAWLESYTPKQIRDANLARERINLIREKLNETTPMKNGLKRKPYPAIKDPRQVKRPMGPFVEFTKERRPSDDFTGIQTTEVIRLISQEWKNMSEAEKKPYLDKAVANKERYIKDFKSVYGEEPNSAVLKRRAAAKA